MEGLTLAQLTTVAGISAGTFLLNEVIWRTANVADAVKDRFGPLVALLTGVGIGVFAGLVLGFGGADLAQDGINGVVGGLASMGIQNLISSRAGAVEADDPCE